MRSLPSALDPFPASDFPHHIFDDPPGLLDNLLGQPTLDPFPASDFPHHVFDDQPGLLDMLGQPALDPFPASDFPHHIFDDPPRLPDDQLGQASALDPFPRSDSSTIPEDRSANRTVLEVPGDCSMGPIAHVDPPPSSTTDLAEDSNHPFIWAEPHLPGGLCPGLPRVPEDVQREVLDGTNPRLYASSGRFSDSGATQAVC